MAVSVESNGQHAHGVKTKEIPAQKAATSAQNGAPKSDATKDFAAFVVNTTLKDIPENVTTKMKALFLDYLGVSVAAGKGGESTASILAGVQAFAGSATGNCTVFTKGSSFPSQYAALLNGALAHTFDFDDTHGPAILHPGASIISAALAESETRDVKGSEFLLAIIIGYEVAIRIGMSLGAGAYAHGFHNTATCGVFGSVAAVSKLRGLSQPAIENAFGLGLSRAAGSMQFLENGSWNKRIHPGFAAHDALLCVCLAESGVVGAAKPIEGKYGMLHNFSGTPDASQLLPELGTKWQLLGTACKPFPACRMTHGQLELVGKFRKRYADKGTPDRIITTLPTANVPVVGAPNPNKIKPETIVDAQFSAYFQIAAAWLHGNTLGWALYDHLHDEDVVALARKITVQADPAYKNLESRVRVEWDDGTVDEEEVVFPLAEPQRPFEWDTGVQRKFLGLVVPIYGEEGAREICRVVESFERESVVELMKRLA